MWKKIFNKEHDSRVTINIRRFAEKMFLKPDYDRMIYKVTPDYENNRLIVSFKHEATKDELPGESPSESV